jgi:hypothetical protein
MSTVFFGWFLMSNFNTPSIALSVPKEIIV